MKIKFTSSLLPFSIVCKLYTRSPVSHCEFVFSDGMSIYPAMEAGRVIQTKTSYRNEFYFDLDVTKKEEQKLRDWAYGQIGKPYDYTALAPWNIFIPRSKTGWKDDSRWMCSEFCSFGLELLDMKLFDDDFTKITPADLFNKFNNKEI